MSKTLKKIEPVQVRATLVRKDKHIKQLGDESTTIQYALFELADGTRIEVAVALSK